MSYSIMMVDSNTIVRRGIMSLFDKDGDCMVIADASTGRDCLETIKKVKPDVIISDLNLPDMDGEELLIKIREKAPETKIIFLTENQTSSDIIRVYDAGFDGYLRKSISFSLLKKAIAKVMSGERYIEPDVVPLLNSKLFERDINQELLYRLTKRETQMLKCVANGLSNKEIAVECRISERTVKNHLSSVFQKIEVADRTQAAVFAIKTNLIQI